MKDEWPQSIAAARQLAAKAGDRVAAIVFREKIVAQAAGPVDTNKLLDELATMKTIRGGTALYNTLIDVAGRVKNRNSALVVISDGEDNMSHYSPEQTVKLFAQSSWPPVFGVVLDYTHGETRRGYFRKIVESTGGLMVMPSSASKVADAVDRLAANIFGSFMVTLEPSRPAASLAKLRLEVVGPGKKVHVAHMAEVGNCEPTQSSSTKSD